jgi:succinoglycan biosynthesis transport protein ExoP
VDLRLIMTALRARWGAALLVLVAVVSLAFAATELLPKKYAATASLLVDIRFSEPMAALLLPTSIATQVGIIQSDRVAQRAVQLLGLDENPALREQWAAETGSKGDRLAWIAERLRRGLDVKPGDVSIINITYYASDPAFAAGAANAFARAYTDTLVELKTGPAAEYSRSFGEQASTLRAELEKAQARLSDYERRAGLLATDNHLDAETARLNQLTSQLTVVQAQIADARSRQNTGSAAADLPGASAGAPGLEGGAIQQLRTQLAQKEVELKEAAVNLGINHPKYRSLEAQRDELKGKLAAETRRVTNNFAVAKRVGLRTETELKAAIAVQKKKLVELKTKYDQMDVLKSDVQRAQAAYDTAARRLTRTSLDSRSTDTNVTVLSPAVAPTKQSFPKPLYVMLMLGVALGAAAGVGVALLLEMVDRRIRSPEDLAGMLELPVLGVIEHRRTRTPALPRRRSVPLLTERV